MTARKKPINQSGQHMKDIDQQIMDCFHQLSYQEQKAFLFSARSWFEAAQEEKVSRRKTTRK